MKDIPPTKQTIRKKQGIELITFQINVIEKYTENEYFKEVLRVFEVLNTFIILGVKYSKRSSSNIT